MRILILGISGMLGSTLFRYLGRQSGLQVFGSCRSAGTLRFFTEQEQARIRHSMHLVEDHDALIGLLNALRPDVVVNCIGLIKQLENAQSPLVALPINSLFPHRVQAAAQLCGARVIHFSTDCVFSGKQGGYVETDTSDAYDIYGKSKYLGELSDYDNAITLRTSIIGHELQSNVSLIDWFLSQPVTANGYTKAIFSGLPTVEVAEVLHKHVLPNTGLKGLYHLSVAPIDKYSLLKLVAQEYQKEITITPSDSVVIDRSLNSERFQRDSGYLPPAWPELVRKMHQFGGQ